MNAAIKFEKEMDRDGDGVISAEEVQVATAYEKATIQSRITIASFIAVSYTHLTLPTILLV